MVLEEVQEQDEPNDGGLNSVGENGLGGFVVESSGDANNGEHSDKIGGIDDSTNRSDSVAKDLKSVATEVAVEKQEQLEDESEGVIEGKLSTEGCSVTNTKPELILPECGTWTEEAVEGDKQVLVLFQPDLAEVHETVDEIKTLENHKSFLLEPNSAVGDKSGSEEDQAVFMKELKTFNKERCLEFKPPRFYGEPLNCLNLLHMPPIYSTDYTFKGP